MEILNGTFWWCDLDKFPVLSLCLLCHLGNGHKTNTGLLRLLRGFNRQCTGGTETSGQDDTAQWAVRVRG